MRESDDVLVGQLAIARGWVSLRQVLDASRDLADQTLGSRLVSSGHLTHEQYDGLVAHIENLEPEDLDGEMRDASTMLLESIHNTRPGESLIFSITSEDALLKATNPTLAPEQSFANTRRSGHHRSVRPDTPGISSRYEILEKLGVGGMGEVWLARDRALLRTVALKILRSEHHEDEEMRERLEIEARVTGALEHPGIVSVYDTGEVEGLGSFYTMRVVRERALDHLLRDRARGKETEFTLIRLLNVVKSALLALAFAHDHGVVHRDIKPENILVGSYGEVFVIDWGVAKIDESNEVLHEHHTLLGATAQALVGTPAFMSPEQARGDNHLIDGRTDVYAMGVILYEVLTMQMLYEAPSVLALLFKASENKFMPPSERAPNLDIPAELEQIVMRALAGDRDDRFDSAAQMANAIEDYLEGVRDMEKRREAAATLMKRASTYHERWKEARSELARSTLDLSAMGQSLESWSPREDKEELWHKELELERSRLDLERLFGRVVSLYGQALAYLPKYAPARRQLAELYWERFVESERAQDATQALYFESLVRHYNDGHYDTLLDGHARLTVMTTVAAEVSIGRYQPGLHRLELVELETKSAPFVDHELPHGSYLLEVSAPGMRTQHIPVLLERLAFEKLEIELMPQGDLPPDAVIVEAGTFLSGEFEPMAPGRGVKHLNRFAMMRHSVTCGEWADFLNDLVAQGRPDEAQAHAPRINAESASYFPVVSGKFVVPTADADGDAWDPQWPICMICYDDALAYAAWRAERDGLPWRLPTALEWEKAARGVDGRLFPWGNRFEPAFCNMRDSYRGRPMPRPVGSHPDDTSPYGVTDVVGNVLNWTSTIDSDQDRTRVLCGASFSSVPTGAKLHDYISAPESYRYTIYGMRLAVTL